MEYPVPSGIERCSNPIEKMMSIFPIQIQLENLEEMFPCCWQQVVTGLYTNQYISIVLTIAASKGLSPLQKKTCDDLIKSTRVHSTIPYYDPTHIYQYILQCRASVTISTANCITSEGGEGEPSLFGMYVLHPK